MFFATLKTRKIWARSVNGGKVAGGWLSRRLELGVGLAVWYFVSGVDLLEGQTNNIIASVVGGLLAGSLVLWSYLLVRLVAIPAITSALRGRRV